MNKQTTNKFSPEVRERIKVLKRENKELRRANEIWKSASAHSVTINGWQTFNGFGRRITACTERTRCGGN